MSNKLILPLRNSINHNNFARFALGFISLHSKYGRLEIAVSIIHNFDNILLMNFLFKTHVARRPQNLILIFVSQI